MLQLAWQGAREKHNGIFKRMFHTNVKNVHRHGQIMTLIAFSADRYDYYSIALKSMLRQLDRTID